MIASYLRALHSRWVASLKHPTEAELHNMDYRDGFKHGFEAGRTSCVGDLSVTSLIKELIDRGELELAARLLDELRDRL